MTMKSLEYRRFTPDELYALEREAHRLRAETMREMFRCAAAAMRSFFTVRSAKGMRHA